MDNGTISQLGNSWFEKWSLGNGKCSVNYEKMMLVDRVEEY